MVNYTFNFAILLGIIDTFLAGGLLFVYIVLSSTQEEKIGSKAGTLLIIQGVSSCLLLGLSGIILFFQGWRLDSVLQFCVFLQTIIIIYFALRDIFIFTVKIFPQNKSSAD